MTYREHLNKLARVTFEINQTRKPGDRNKTMVEVANRILELGCGTTEEKDFLKQFIYENDDWFEIIGKEYK